MVALVLVLGGVVELGELEDEDDELELLEELDVGLVDVVGVLDELVLDDDDEDDDELDDEQSLCASRLTVPTP